MSTKRPTATQTPDGAMLTLDPTINAPRLARDFLVKCFCDLGIADDYVGQTVVSELVTNVYKHVRTGQIVVRIFTDDHDGSVVVEVSDQGENMPVIREAENSDLSGRGLYIMSMLVRAWGVRPTNNGGKTVWVKLDR
ncbi:ATP-binding protein [Actinomadura meridiana]|uniref:ATP-binding protein n=1 Tax=Actinomadura meridiana TaxID=559626 RepID=UPI0031EC4069